MNQNDLINQSLQLVVEEFVEREMAQIKEVAKRLNQSLDYFIQCNFICGKYDYILHNGDNSSRYLRDNLDPDLFGKLTERHFDRFIHHVNKRMNEHFLKDLSLAA